MAYKRKKMKKTCPVCSIGFMAIGPQKYCDSLCQSLFNKRVTPEQLRVMKNERDGNELLRRSWK